jgi:hypothetical protein
MSNLFIVNEVDRPTEHSLAELRDGKLYYIHPVTWRAHATGMTTKHAQPLESLGVSVERRGRHITGVAVGESTVYNQKGKLRVWEGASKFALDIPEPTVRAPKESYIVTARVDAATHRKIKLRAAQSPEKLVDFLGQLLKDAVDAPE